MAFIIQKSKIGASEGGGLTPLRVSIVQRAASDRAGLIITEARYA
jgi:hypothetical protein